MSSPAAITRTPMAESSAQTSGNPSSKNWASSMPTTSISLASNSRLLLLGTGVLRMVVASWLTTSDTA